MKKITGSLIVAIILVPFFSMASNSINWGATDHYIYENDGSTLLEGSDGDGDADLVQLIYAGPNGVADTFDSSDPQLVGGDDVYAAYSWVGFGRPPSEQDGQFNVSDADAYTNDRDNGANYYIRAFDDPAAAAGTGNHPAIDGTSQWYGNSEIFTVAGNPEGGPSQGDDFYTTGDIQTDIQWIPEPTTAILAFVGVCTLIYRRKRIG